MKLPEINLPFLSFLKNRESIAIDIGSSAIKIVSLKHSGNKYSLLKWGVIPVNESGAELSPQDRKNIAVARIAEFLAREKIISKNVVSSITGNQVIVRYVRFPKLSHEELAKTIQFEAEPYIPFDIREVDLSFHIVGDVVEDGQKKMETILVASKKEAIQSKLEIFNELNLRTVLMDLDVFAIQNAFEYYNLSSETPTQETVLLINIGANVTNMAIMENNISKVVRDVFISGNSFTKAIMRNLGCDFKSAEDLKFRYSLLVTAEEKEKTLSENQKEALQVSSAITPVSKDLLIEVQRSIDFYISQNPERVINRILLCGGSSAIKNLDRYLHQELKVPIELFNPVKNMLDSASVPDDIAPQLAVAVGLAMRRENDINK
jgi:type IV pilus assembly protein PilM